MTDTIGVASFLADFHVLSRFASLEYVEYAGVLLTLIIAYYSDTNVYITRKNPPKMKKHIL
jgi:hypothetical protein